MRLKDLLNEGINRVDPYLYMDFELGRNLSYPEQSIISKQIDKLLKDVTNYMTDEILIVKFPIPSASYGTRKVSNYLFEKVEKIVLETLEDFEETVYNGGEYVIIVKGLPSFPISSEAIEIQADRTFEFKGIEKLISNTDKLTIKDVNSIRPCPVLSILNLKKVQKVRLISHLNTKGWWNIVQDHLDGDRDILDCQEELAKAGYKEYAKL